MYVFLPKFRAVGYISLLLSPMILLPNWKVQNAVIGPLEYWSKTLEAKQTVTAKPQAGHRWEFSDARIKTAGRPDNDIP